MDTNTRIFTAKLITIEPCGRVLAIVSTKVIYSTIMKKLIWIIQPLTAIALGMLITINLLIYALWYLPSYTTVLENHQQLGNTVVKHLAFETTAPLYAEDRVLLSNILNRFADEPFVISASVGSEEPNGLLLSSRTKQSTKEDGDDFQFPIHFSNELLGTAHLIINKKAFSHWRSQAMASWLLFNVFSAALLLGFIYYRHIQNERSWKPLQETLQQQMPDIASQLSGTSDQKLRQLMSSLRQPITRQGVLVKEIQAQLADSDTERLIEQIALVSSDGGYQDIALVSIQCQNWDDLIRYYPANELQAMWSQYESIMMKVSELYSGIVLPDGFTLVFGLSDEDEYVFNSVCAARVLQLALQKIALKSGNLSPTFGIVVSAGPAFVSKTQKHGIPLPLVTGDADVWLSQLRALQPVDQILLAEPVLQNSKVNEMIEASLLRDITLRNGQRLEVWELDRFEINDDLLYSQAQTLTATIG